jgi:hypothetical protein
MSSPLVIAGRDPAIHEEVPLTRSKLLSRIDARAKPGHDEQDGQAGITGAAVTIITAMRTRHFERHPIASPHPEPR